jgi:hypothetical protein
MQGSGLNSGPARTRPNQLYQQGRGRSSNERISSPIDPGCRSRDANNGSEGHGARRREALITEAGKGGLERAVDVTGSPFIF